jgi:hypothetical protein
MEANAQQRAKWVERWKDSGLTAKEFAAESGVKVSALYNWSWQQLAGARRSSGAAAKTRVILRLRDWDCRCGRSRAAATLSLGHNVLAHRHQWSVLLIYISSPMSTAESS